MKFYTSTEAHEVKVIDSTNIWHSVDITGDYIGLGWVWDDEQKGLVSNNPNAFKNMLETLLDFKYGAGEFWTGELVNVDDIEIWVDGEYIEII